MRAIAAIPVLIAAVLCGGSGFLVTELARGQWRPVQPPSASFRLPPSAVAPNLSGGFTNTGLAPVDGGWLVASDGRAGEGDETFRPSLILLTEDFSTILDEWEMTDILPGVDTLQGLAVDPARGVVWVADKRSRGDSGFLHAFSIEEGRIVRTLALDFSPNGLAYRNTDDTFLVGSDDTTIRLIAAEDGALRGTLRAPVAEPDHLFWTGSELLLTSGRNGKPGTVHVLGPNAEPKDKIMVAAEAIEGVVLIGGDLYISSDGGFHTRADRPYALIDRYDWSTRTASLPQGNR